MSEGIHYRMSGKLGMGFLAPVAGIVAACVLGFLYGYINVYNPLIYIQGLATCLYGFGLGWIVAKVAEATRCRNLAFTGFSGLLAGLAGLYVAWGVFLYALMGQSDMTSYIDPDTGSPVTISTLDVVLNPKGVWIMIPALAESGWFTLGRSGGNVSGILLWLFWIAEALIVVGAATVAAYIFHADRVFCEACGGWCKEQSDVARTIPSAKPAVTEGLKRGDLSVLLDVPVPQLGASEFFRVDQFLCEKCKDMGTVKVVHFAKKVNNDGKEEVSKSDVCKHVLLTPETIPHLGQLMARGKYVKPEKKAAPEKLPPETKASAGSADAPAEGDLPPRT